MSDLTERERDIVRMIDEGLVVDDIAEAMYLSRSTIRAKVRRIARKLTGDERRPWRDLPEVLARVDGEA